MLNIRTLAASLFFLATLHGSSQCGPYKGHPIFPDSLGTAFINLEECGDYTSRLWDDGSTGYLAEDLSVGNHSVILFQGAVPMDTIYFEIQQLQWQTFLTVTPISSDSWTELDYCGTSIFNFHKCTPDPDSTVIYLLQNGVAIDSVPQISCPIEILFWPGVPMGYSYQTYIEDHGTCGSYAYSPLISTFSLAGANMVIQTNSSTNGSNGSIEVLEVVPDPGSSLPAPPSPITGTFTLWSMPDYTPIADQQAGTTALWNSLAPGNYMITFNADSLSDQVTAAVTIDMNTGIEEGMGAGLVIWPIPVNDLLHWNVPSSGGFRILDIQGHVVLEGPNGRNADVSGLASGSYSLHLSEGRVGRFVKY
jgi:hypothetical protein